MGVQAATAWSLISLSILLTFSSWRTAIDIVQVRKELTQIWGDNVSRYEIKQLFNTSRNTISEIIERPARPAPPLPTRMMFSQSCFVSHPSGMAPLEYAGLQLGTFFMKLLSLKCAFH